MTSLAAREPAVSTPTIGRDAGPFGRVFRLLSGLLAVGAGITGLVTDRGGPPAVLQTVGYVLGLAVFYPLLHRGLAQRISDRVDPFLATVVLLGPLGVFGLSVFPHPLHTAVGLYIGASLILAAAIGYGGCEVVALPTVLFGHRAVGYCPINILDAAERPLHRRGDRTGRAAGVIALAVGSWYLIISPVLDRFGLPELVSRWWALLLLAPAVVLADHAWRARRVRAAVIGYALGAAAVIAGAAVLTGLMAQDLAFGIAVLAGLLLAAVRWVTGIVRGRAQRLGRGADGALLRRSDDGCGLG